MNAKEKKRQAFEAYRQHQSNNPEFMTLDELRDYADRHNIPFSWIKGRIELYEDLKRAGVMASD